MKKKTQNKIKKEIKNTHHTTLIVVVLVFILAIAGGVGTSYYLTRNDCFKLNGEKEITLALNETYEELGATVISLGQDLSSKVTIKGSVDTSTEGEYALIYKVDSIKYGSYQLVRIVKVGGGE